MWGANMIRTDILAASPIFLVGLIHTLSNAGMEVVAARTSLDQEPSWLADAALIDVALSRRVDPGQARDENGEEQRARNLLDHADAAGLPGERRGFESGAKPEGSAQMFGRILDPGMKKAPRGRFRREWRQRLLDQT